MPFRLTPREGAYLLEDGTAGGPRRRVEVAPAVAARSRYVGHGAWVDGRAFVVFLDPATGHHLMQYQPEEG
jgi:hypothetical protein